MDMTFEKYLELQQKNVLVMLEDKSEVEGKVLGCRQDENGELNYILIQEERELKPILIGEIKYIIPAQS